MRYWGLFAGKLSVIAGLLYPLWRGVTRWLPEPHLIENQFLGYDLAWTLMAGLFFLIGCGATYVAVLDQRYRCRVCLRRLRMPIATGSWGQILQKGWPRIEYICPFGHGTLKISALQISGLDAPDWEANEDLWRELVAAEDNSR